MNRFTRRLLSLLAVSMLMLGLLIGSAAAQDAQPEHILIPIGGGYPDTFPGFLEAALPYVATLDTDRFYILMMPMSFTYDVEVLTTTDLLDNSLAIERRRRQFERACDRLVSERELDLECQVVVPPIYTRDAAEDDYALEYFTDDLAAVYFVGGDQTFAMQILNGTPLEAALTEAFERGVVMGGNSAGAAIMSYNMIGGYSSEDYDVVDQLREGIVDLWTEPDRRGLPFGLRSVIVEQHFFEYGRPGRLLNAILQPGMPRVGLGVDGFTGAVVVDDARIDRVIGKYSVGVIDATDAADSAYFSGDGILSVRGAWFHTLAPGDFSYDLLARQHSLAPLPERPQRDYSGFALPEGAGTLILGSDLTSVGLADNPVIERFLELAGGSEAEILVLSTGYRNLSAAVNAFEDYAAQFTGRARRVQVQTLLTRMALPDLTRFSGIVVVAGDQSLVTADELRPIADALLAGIPVLADNAAAPLFGIRYAANPPVDYDNDDDATMEAHDQGAYILGNTVIADGLGLVRANVEPRLIDNNRYGRVISLAYDDPAALALGLAEGSALEVTPQGTTVLGTNGVVLFDFSVATLALGDNDAFVIANGLMDVFAPGDRISE
jgi:cyanophycinase